MPAKPPMMFQATPSVANMNVMIATWSGNGPPKARGKPRRATAAIAAAAIPIREVPALTIRRAPSAGPRP